jgi:ElaB/YqjD/DUF883 family membrane-anchored ribosome-binding protein
MTDKDPRNDKTSDELRLEVAETRAKVAEDVQALGHKLAPANLRREAQEAVSRTVRDGAVAVRERALQNTMVQSVRQNPIPYALIGVGIGWLWFGSRRNGGRAFTYRTGPQRRYDEPRAYGYGEFTDEGHFDAEAYAAESYEGLDEGSDYFAAEHAGYAGRAQDVRQRAGEVTQQAREKARDLAGSAGEKLRDARGRVGRGARQVSARAKQQARYVSDQAEHVWHENPLAIGAVALAAGAAVGLMLPRTSAEDRFMGDMRDRLLDVAQEKARTAQQVATESARRAMDTAKQAAREGAEQRGLWSGQGGEQSGEQGAQQKPQPGASQHQQPGSAQSGPPAHSVSVHEVKTIGEQPSTALPPRPAPLTPQRQNGRA